MSHGKKPDHMVAKLTASNQNSSPLSSSEKTAAQTAPFTKKSDIIDKK